MILNEDLFDEIDMSTLLDRGYRIDMSMYDDSPQEDAIEGPSTPEEVGTSHLILDAISKVTEMISMYNDLLANTDNEEIIQIVNEIAEDNNKHMGMLQSALEVVSPNAEAIEDGTEEADNMLDESVLPVNDLGTLSPQEIARIESRRDALWDREDRGILTSEERDELNKLQFEINRHYAVKKQLMGEAITEDIHDKFKKDIKNDYKAWAAKQEKQEAKRKEFLSMLDEIENVTSEQREKMEKAANDLFPDEEFNYKFPHNIEKEDFPFYVTYYAEYPIYEPAEGGYYYAGRDAIWSEGFNTKEDALDYAKKYTSEDSDTWEELTDGFICRGKYIGEDQYVRIEDNKSYLSDEKGWEPYQ